MIFKTFSTNWNDKYEFSNDIIFEYEYEGVDDVPYLSEAFSVGVGAGTNYLILAIDECSDTIMGAIVVHVGETETYNGTGAKSWILSVGVHPDYQGKGISRFLVHEFFQFAEENNIGKVEQSSYTDDGLLKIKHLFEEIKDEYPDVEYIDVLNIDANNYCVSIE